MWILCNKKVGKLENYSVHFLGFIWCHKLTVNKYCSPHDKISKNCGPLILLDNIRNYVTNQRKTTFLHEIETIHTSCFINQLEGCS